MCIGQTMAKVIWMTYFTGLLHRYTFLKSPDHPDPSLEPTQGVTNTPKPFHVLVKLRDWYRFILAHAAQFTLVKIPAERKETMCADLRISYIVVCAYAGIKRK